MSNLKPSDLHFLSSTQPTLSTVLGTLRRDNLTIHNRLRSCLSDSAFVLRVHEAFNPPAPSSLSPPSSTPEATAAAGEGEEKPAADTQSTSPQQRPLIANERCGSWYVRPEDKGGSAYFKSTDGHERAWKFSTRRLNLHLIELIEKNDGVIIVDSTRRGKRMPDALSTTIPIWCTVLNQHLLPTHPLSSELHLPPSHSASTHSQITSLIPGFVKSLQDLNLQTLPTLTKPLRPIWITQESSLEPRQQQGEIFEDYRPVICCTASRRVTKGKEMDEGGYIQGAGDDTENWACGLTPDVFWRNVELLLQTEEDDLPDLIKTLIEKHRKENEGRDDRVRLTSRISGTTLPLPTSLSKGECQISLLSTVTPASSWIQSPKSMAIGLGKSKVASKNLRTALPEISSFAAKFLSSHPQNGQIVIACESGKDLSVGTALALSCYLFDDEGNYRGVPGEETLFTKSLVKVRLGGIMTAFPGANPSRNTLQSVNSFLMDWRR